MHGRIGPLPRWLPEQGQLSMAPLFRLFFGVVQCGVLLVTIFQ